MSPLGEIWSGQRTFQDLAPCDFFLSRLFLKSRGYFNRPRALQGLKANFRGEIASIPPDMLC